MGPLSHWTMVLMSWGAVGEEQVDMVACDLPREDLEFPLHGNLADEIAQAEGDRPDEDRFPGPSGSRPGGPCSQIGCAGRPGTFARSHTTTPFASPEGEGIPPSPNATLRLALTRHGKRETKKRLPTTSLRVIFWYIAAHGMHSRVCRFARPSYARRPARSTHQPYRGSKVRFVVLFVHRAVKLQGGMKGKI